ncbi:MAG: hypothetical protein CM15mP120_28120 [Pseudomonadota bacterium]|nr:MAG: hypothetical protein CM15mP120_28120 [Pseudomonadota bacterium]
MVIGRVLQGDLDTQAHDVGPGTVAVTNALGYDKIASVIERFVIGVVQRKNAQRDWLRPRFNFQLLSPELRHRPSFAVWIIL